MDSVIIVIDKTKKSQVVDIDESGSPFSERSEPVVPSNEGAGVEEGSE